MGSRDRPNFGGSGAQLSRSQWANKKQHCDLNNIPFKFSSKTEVEEYLDDNQLMCFECGGMYKSLGNHLRLSHAYLDKNAYREKYNIPQTYPLVSKDLLEKASHRMQTKWKDPDYREAHVEQAANIHKLQDREKERYKWPKDLVEKSELFKKTARERQKALTEKCIKKYRPKYIEVLNFALSEKIRLTEAARKLKQPYVSIGVYVKTHKDDCEIQELYKKVMLPGRANKGKKKQTLLKAAECIRLTERGTYVVFVSHTYHGQYATLEEAIIKRDSIRNKTTEKGQKS